MKRKLLLAGLFALLCWCPARTAELADARCYRCHKDVREAFSRGQAHAPIVEGDCWACHDAHGAARELRLLAEVPELCFGCHEEPSKLHSHAPVARGNCLSCHDPHVSDCRALLVESYPLERKARFSVETYALCFQCHDPLAFTDSTPDAPTDFRSQRQNLHFVHTVRDTSAHEGPMRTNTRSRPGLTCWGCHRAHGSDQHKLLRRSFEHNGFTAYTINFTRTDRDGSCVTGCHRPERYEAIESGNISSGAKPRSGEKVN